MARLLAPLAAALSASATVLAEGFFPHSPRPSDPTSSAQVFTLTLLTDAVNEGAVSLDGSPAAYYLFEGAEKNKWYIHQQGGGWCSSDDDCLSRSKGALGSTKGLKPTETIDGGYFSSDPAVNPLMWNFSKIFLPYTDGGSQTGDLTEPVKVGNSTIYYRGHRILNAMISALKARALNTATEVIVSGCSAGGLATFLHADEWGAALPNAKVTAMPDSGFFLDYNATANKGYGSLMRWVFSAMNSSGGVPAACIAANSDDPARCIFAEHVVPYSKVPLFPLQSKYDSWQIGNDLDNKTPAAINAWGTKLRGLVEENLLGPTRLNGVFLDSCNHHCGEWGITIDGQPTALAHQQWYRTLSVSGSKKEWNQNGTTPAYPCASCCKIA